MATAAERARKRDLGPDWREKLRDSVRLMAVRTVGTVLVAGSLAIGVALATHDSTDPSLSTAAGGPPVNWVGAPGAYSSDLLLMLFGPEFEVGVAPLAVLCLTLCVRSVFGPAAMVLSIHDRPYATLPAVALGMTVLVAANLLLVPTHGLMGAAIAALSAQTIWSAAMSKCSWMGAASGAPS